MPSASQLGSIVHTLEFLAHTHLADVSTIDQVPTYHVFEIFSVHLMLFDCVALSF